MKHRQPIVSISPFIVWVSCLLFVCQSCERINKEKNENLEVAVQFAALQSELLSVVECVDEIADQSNGNGISSTVNTTFLGKNGLLELVDSTYQDGDGIEFFISFSDPSLPFSQAQKSMDGKYRAGKIWVKIVSHYQENTAIAEVKIDKEMRYSVGITTNNPREFVLSMTLVRVLKQTFDIKVGELSQIGISDPVQLTGQCSMEKVVGITSPGILGDHYLFNGKGLISEADGHNFSWAIALPLLKKMEPGCAMACVKGVVGLNDDKDNKRINIDYDPFENEACDRFVRATIAGKIIDFEIE